MALLDSLVVALDNLGERYTVGGEVLTRSGNIAFTGSSTGVYTTSDGHVAVSAGAERRRLAPLLRDHRPRRPDPRSRASPPQRRAAIDATRSARSSRRGRPRSPRPRWCASWPRAGVPAAPVNNVAEMVADPQVQAREMFVERDHPDLRTAEADGDTAQDVARHRAACARWRRMPGEHNEEIFVGLLGHSQRRPRPLAGRRRRVRR